MYMYIYYIFALYNSFTRTLSMLPLSLLICFIASAIDKFLLHKQPVLLCISNSQCSVHFVLFLFKPVETGGVQLHPFCKWRVLLVNWRKASYGDYGPDFSNMAIYFINMYSRWCWSNIVQNQGPLLEFLYLNTVLQKSHIAFALADLFGVRVMITHNSCALGSTTHIHVCTCAFIMLLLIII